MRKLEAQGRDFVRKPVLLPLTESCPRASNFRQQLLNTSLIRFQFPCLLRSWFTSYSTTVIALNMPIKWAFAYLAVAHPRMARQGEVIPSLEI